MIFFNPYTIFEKIKSVTGRKLKYNIPDVFWSNGVASQRCVEPRIFIQKAQTRCVVVSSVSRGKVDSDKKFFAYLRGIIGVVYMNLCGAVLGMENIRVMRFLWFYLSDNIMRKYILANCYFGII